MVSDQFANDVARVLQALVEAAVNQDEGEEASALLYELGELLTGPGPDTRVTSYEAGGYLTEEAGFVIRVASGPELQVTVRR